MAPPQMDGGAQQVPAQVAVCQLESQAKGCPALGGGTFRACRDSPPNTAEPTWREKQVGTEALCRGPWAGATDATLSRQRQGPVSPVGKPEGCEHLRRLLKWEEFEELGDPCRGILLDTLYESVIFAVSKGFPWAEVAKVVQFTEELLKETKGCSVTGAVTTLGNELRDYQGQFSTTLLLALCDCFHNTFIRHYKLQQYVLGHDQDANLTVTQLEVCVPPQPLPLSQGKDRAVWQHEQQVAELDAAEVQKRANVLLLKEALRVERERRLQKTFLEAPAQQSRVLKREELENLINKAIHIQMECLKEQLQCEIQTTFDILDLKLQKKTLTLNAPIPVPVSITSQPGQDEALKSHKTNKGKKAKAKRK